jgi:valyl-tRNA synthetase
MSKPIASKYNPANIEDKLYQCRMDKGFFHAEPDERAPFTIVIPPPNVTGVLHMGHMLNNTIQDVLVRKARMEGKNACWVPGTDHASIATEAKVVAKLKEEGIDKHDLSREKFLEHAWDWTHKHGGIILDQLKKLGASCDWERTRFTMDPNLSEQVISVFIDLFNKGQIYRGVRMVNWDPAAKTALSDEEVIRKEVNGGLYYVNYKIAGSDEYLTIATTRPETILGDTAICIHPEDERYKHLHGKKAVIPMVDREVPIIFDEYVDKDFGTGCLKVTPAHDINDYELGIKHNLETIDIFNEDGTLNKHGAAFTGLSREEARKAVIKELKKLGILDKVEDIVHNVGFSERSHAAIEPRLSLQWFLKMDNLSKPALDNVMNDEVRFFPSKFKNSYRHWMENVHDWCISRQLWWGHQIPVFYFGLGINDYVVGRSAEEVLEEARKRSGNPNLRVSDLKQDEDVLDTWFSSWLWPISVFDGLIDPDNDDINYYYPSNDLVTAPEIMFFWVARMIISGYEYRDQKPFKNVYYTGIVRDKQGRKMSKSLGNSPDPIKMMEEYGADGVRVGMLLSSPAGNDLLFDVSLVGQGRNFANKVWNAYRLVSMWTVDENIDPTPAQMVANKWFDSRFNKALKNIDRYYDEFRISDALMATYKLIWDDYCSWYLEMIKPEYQKPISSETLRVAKNYFEKILKVLHPFMPFISEEIWQAMEDRMVNESLVVSEWPKVGEVDEELLSAFGITKEVVTNVRKIRKEKNIANKEKLSLIVKENKRLDKVFGPAIVQLCNLDHLDYKNEKPENAFGFVVKSNEYFVPFSENVDVEVEIEKIQKELEYIKGFLVGVDKKLSNQRFVDNAPPKVVEIELRKKADAEHKMDILEAKLEAFTDN